jgi:hypothetical protein
LEIEGIKKFINREGSLLGRAGVEPATRGFSVHCSTT